jgi:hypothetical protein
MAEGSIDGTRDRRVGLVAFGVVQIVIGLTCIALLFGVIAGNELAIRAGASPGSVASLVFVYGVLAFHFIVNGTGSMRARRWARAVSAAVAALWLAGGAVATVATVVIVPKIAPHTPLTRVALMMLIVFIALPLVLLMFYARADVRMTCERRDHPRWTDRVPLPVLALVLVMAFFAAWLLVNLSAPTVPMFGAILTGAEASLTLLILAGVCGVLAVQLYRLKEAAWWSLLLLQIIGCVLAGSTMARTPGPVYRDPVVWTIVTATWVGYFAFLLYVRRYFAGGRGGRPHVVAAT